ncbi:MAG: 2-nitropropane dioxygenase [Edaphobacter sp.]|nr:2-nitropropane dioxygenase [Edaphobacter sp.]
MNVTSQRLGQSARNNARRSSSARKVGIDLIVASGFEGGGGHRGSILRSPADSVVGGFSLIPVVADAVEVRVIAAG